MPSASRVSRAAGLVAAVLAAGAMLASCGESDRGDFGTVRIESMLVAGEQFDGVRLQLAETATAEPFHDTTWRIGVDPPLELPAEVVVIQGRAGSMHVVVEALLGDFVVDRQLGEIRFAEPEARQLLVRLREQFTCGNGRVDADEQCDCGIASTKPASCSTANSDLIADACRRSCVLPVCGDGVTDAGEQCDDGNRVAADVCTNDCGFNVCGDGVPLPGVLCFDAVAGAGEQASLAPVLLQADLDGDGRVDLITRPGAASGDTLQLRHNQGNGVFAAPVSLDTSQITPYAVVPADLNADELADFIFYQEQYGKIATAVADGEGGYRTREQQARPGGPTPVVPFASVWLTGAIDGDEQDDVLIASPELGRIDVLLADGTGGWVTGTPMTLAEGLADVTAGSLADVDGDGRTDCLLGHGTGENRAVAIWLGDGAGQFSYLASFSLPGQLEAAPGPVRAIVPLDVDAQHVDLALFTARSIYLFLGDGRGGFQFRSRAADVEGNLSTPILTDFEVNRRPDLFLPFAATTVEIGNDGEIELLKTRLPPTAQVSTAGAVADFDGDGLPDIAKLSQFCVTCTGPGFEVFLNKP